MLEQYLGGLFTELKKMNNLIFFLVFLFRCPATVPRGTVVGVSPAGGKGGEGHSELVATSLVQAFYVDTVARLI